MPATAEKLVEAPEVPAIRRFQMPDLQKHGGWIAERLLKLYPHRTENDLVGFLRGVMTSSEFLFLYQEHAVALAVAMHPHPLAAKPVIHEIFVLAEKGHEAEAAAMYDEFARWARPRGIDTIVVEEMSDVPHELIREKFGRVFMRQQQFVRL